MLDQNKNKLIKRTNLTVQKPEKLIHKHRYEMRSGRRCGFLIISSTTKLPYSPKTESSVLQPIPTINVFEKYETNY